MRSICLHGHYYQPPREDPWLGVPPRDPSAAPDRDWNTRITRECYAPAAAARLLDGAGRLRDTLNLYEWTSFDAAPTLLGWLEPHAPAVWRAIRAADEASRHRTGFGNAWAQPFVHAILPLASARDVRTHIHWGRRDFEHRFGRAADGMWLPEMAVDLNSLAAMADAGIGITLLAPHQAAAVRPLADPSAPWTAVTPETLDVRRVYACHLPGGRTINVLFRDAERSQDIAFGALLRDGRDLAGALAAGLGAGGDGLLSIAVDGETYGHHHRFAEMAVAYAIDLLRQRDDVLVTNPAAHAAAHPPTFEVAIAENTSWSCAHGIERWRSNCGCRTGGEAGWSQAWRTPLRSAVDWLCDELAVLFETRGGEQLRDPWGARDRYVDCLLAPGRVEAFVTDEGRSRLSPGDRIRARCALEMQRHALLMQTSCGWFFDDLAGIEPLLVMRHAARAIDLAGRSGRILEAGFLDRLVPARSNTWAGGSGADLYRIEVRQKAVTYGRVAATAILLQELGDATAVPGYDVQTPSGQPAVGSQADVVVVEQTTGWREHATVSALAAVGNVGRYEVDGVVYGVEDLLDAQRESVLAAAASSVRAAPAAGPQVRWLQVARGLMAAGGVVVPPEVLWRISESETAALAVSIGEGRCSVDQAVTQAQALRSAGIPVTPEWLVAPIVAALADCERGLPESGEEMERWLDFAAGIGVQLDLAALQVALVGWRNAAEPAARQSPAFRRLCARLQVVADD